MRNVVFIMMVAVLAACEYNNITYEKPVAENPDTYIPLSNNYLPLTIGNYWNFEITDSTLGLPKRIHREVVSIVTINDHKYYLLIDTSTKDNYNLDSSYYRIDSNDFVYIYRKSSPGYEDNRFRLDGNDHDTWSYLIESGDLAQVTLTIDTITVHNTIIVDSKNYYYDVIKWVDEENTITLAPGIGFVKEYSNAWGIGQVLKSAKINGQVINF